DAAENDEFDENSGMLEFHYVNAINALNCSVITIDYSVLDSKLFFLFSLRSRVKHVNRGASACPTGPVSIALDDSACAACSSLSSTVFSFVDSCVDE
ncbi:hypothetical protein A2U01_0001592, partial [Trifolium medium]|nr:hypothetical protein [Trifolium medium]